MSNTSEFIKGAWKGFKEGWQEPAPRETPLSSFITYVIYAAIVIFIYAFNGGELIDKWLL